MRGWLAVVLMAGACSFEAPDVDDDDDVVDAARPDSAPASDSVPPDDAGQPDAAASDADPSEPCNGLDDDGDGAIDEDHPVGQPCDGEDADACLEGAFQCAPDGLGVVCDDATGDAVEVCNDLDDDCDGVADDGIDKLTSVTDCGSCGIVCTNAFGTTACAGG